jgi:hypothetical protein
LEEESLLIAECLTQDQNKKESKHKHTKGQEKPSLQARFDQLKAISKLRVLMSCRMGSWRRNKLEMKRGKEGRADEGDGGRQETSPRVHAQQA